MKRIFGLMATIIFLLLLLAALLFIRPIFSAIRAVAQKEITLLQERVDKDLGLKLTYQGLSPAILTSIHLKGVKISCGTNRLVEVKDTRLRYSILHLLHDVIHYRRTGEIGTESFRDLEINGVTVDLDRKKINFLNDLLKKVTKNSNKTTPSPSLTDTDIIKTIKPAPKVITRIKKILEAFPVDISVRHVRFLYTEPDTPAGPVILNAYMRRFGVDFRESSHGGKEKDDELFLTTNGDVSVQAAGLTVSSLYDLNGQIMSDLDGSNLAIHLKRVTDGNLSLNTLNLSCGYNASKINIHTVQNRFPLYLIGVFDTKSLVADLSLKTEDLNVSQIVTAKRGSKTLDLLKTLTNTTNTLVSYDVEKKKLDYSSRGSIRVARDDPLKLSFNIAGNEKKINIKRFDVESKNINASANISCIFRGLQLNGDATLFNYTLPNGGEIATQVFLESNVDGFTAFAPNLQFTNIASNENIMWTGLEARVHKLRNSIDFSIEVRDYSHEETDPGLIQVTGSYQLKEKFLTTSLDTNNIFLDSIAQNALFFGRTINNHKENKFSILSNWALNSEIYASMDFKKIDFRKGVAGFGGLPLISFNMPYTLVINTKKDNEAVYLSADGSNDSIQISSLNLVAGKFNASLSGIVERTQKSGVAFVMFDTKVGDLPYHLTGTASKEAVSLTGDYNFALDAHQTGSLLNDDAQFDGSIGFDQLPIPVALNDKGEISSENIMWTSLDAGFQYSTAEGLNAIISRLLAQGTGGRYPFAPKFEATGVEITKYGAFCNKVRYSDIFSQLEGTSTTMWSFSNGIFDNASFVFGATDSQGVRLDNEKESLTVNLSFSNPNMAGFSLDFLLHDLYFNGQVEVKNFELNRFTRDTSNKNLITGAVIASGTLDNPYVAFNIDEFAYTNGKTQISAMVSAYLEEKVLTIENTLFHVNRLSLTNINAKFDLSTLTGHLTSDLDTYAIQRTLHMPLELSIDNVFREEGTLIPTEATVTLSCPEVGGTWIKVPFGFSLTALHSGDMTTIWTNDEIGLVGSISNGGLVTASIDKTKPLSFNMTGDLSGDRLDFLIDDITAELGPIFAFTNFPYVNVFKAHAEGALAITGMKKEPDFSGLITATGIDLNVPIVVPDHITVKEAQAIFDHQTISIPEVEGYIKGNNKVFASAGIYLAGLGLDHVEANLRTPPGKFAPLDLKLDVAEFAGQASANVNLWYQDKYLDITGFVNARRAFGVTTVQQIMGLPVTIIPLKKNKKSAIELMPLPYFIRCDMKIRLLNHCTFRLEPLIRAVFTPQGELQFKYDMEDNSMQFDGEVAIRTGDISWLNRNFYLKSGKMKFSPNEEKFNPIVSLQAQTREKDEDGNNITLMLDVNNQYLMDLSPRITSVPARSEQQLQEILGQVVIADATGTGEKKANGGGGLGAFALSVGDYALQSTLGRTIENKMRDFLHLDILSLRMNVIQNALKLNTQEQERLVRNKDFNLQNNASSYFDNTTLYFGKYLGSHLYADAMLHTGFDESRIDDPLTINGLVFKPEIGLELESPFANIRWNMAPDISSAGLFKFSASTSITLSWKWAL